MPFLVCWRIITKQVIQKTQSIRHRPQGPRHGRRRRNIKIRALFSLVVCETKTVNTNMLSEYLSRTYPHVNEMNTIAEESQQNLIC